MVRSTRGDWGPNVALEHRSEGQLEGWLKLHREDELDGWPGFNDEGYFGELLRERRECRGREDC